MDEIQKLRKKIDKVDDLLVAVLAKRVDLVKRIQLIKKQKHIPPVDQKRKLEIIKRAVKKGEKKGLKPAVVKKVFTAIHDTLQFILE